MKVYLLVDFGSTYTKVTAIDPESETVVGRAQAPTTAETDISAGLDQALLMLYSTTGLSENEICGRYASSSAAGGLKMVAIGLVPDLTLDAARRAALGAGAKVTGAYGFEIDRALVSEIEDKHCDIIMLCGGTDGGNKKTILHNATMLAKSKIDCPVLVCGNRVVSGQIEGTLKKAGKRVYVTQNVLPGVTEINIEPAQNLIREIFIEHIIKAKGLDKIKDRFDKPIIPTPKASLTAAELLADGTSNEAGIGSLLVVEVGGATTNIHSVTDIMPFTQQTVVRGLPETRASRTVEGDLGIRFNARTIFDFVGPLKLKQLAERLAPGAEACDPDAYTSLLNKTTGHIPQTHHESLMDIALATSAVKIAVDRHAGELKTEFSAIGEINIQHGKNLFEVKNILGTGGIFSYGAEPGTILEAALFSDSEPWSLKPRAPVVYLDSDYLLYAMGLFSQEDPDIALRIMKKHLKPVSVKHKND